MGTKIEGIAAAETIDSSGEVLEMRGLDTSSLEKDGILNWEHSAKEPSQIVGKILKSKKIFGEKDCETESQLRYWNRIKVPFLWIVGELFDDVGHNGAQDVAAMARYDQRMRQKGLLGKNGVKPLVNFSVEGSKINKEGANIKSSIARKISVTIHACNKVCEAELYVEPKKVAAKKLVPFMKSEADEFHPLDKVETPSLGATKSGKPIFVGARAHEYEDFTSQDHKDAANMHYEASMTAGPKQDYHKMQFNAHTRMAERLSTRERPAMPKAPSGPAPTPSLGTKYVDIPGKGRGMDKNQEKPKHQLKKAEQEADYAVSVWKHAEQFRDFMKNRAPDMTEREVQALGKAMRLMQWRRAEKRMKDIS